MRHLRSHKDTTDINAIRAKQSNIVWPDVLKNSKGIDAFFWYGSPRPTGSQRVAAWLVGSTFLAIGLVELAYAKGNRYIPEFLLAYAALLVGARIFRNGFPHKRDDEQGK